MAILPPYGEPLVAVSDDKTGQPREAGNRPETIVSEHMFVRYGKDMSDLVGQPQPR
jgi:hypothetical protein